MVAIQKFFVSAFFSSAAFAAPISEADWVLFAKSNNVTVEINRTNISVDATLNSVAFSVRTSDIKLVTTEDVTFLCDQDLMISSHRVTGSEVQNDVKIVKNPRKPGQIITELFNFACPKKPELKVTA